MSEFGKINWFDFGKGLLVAILTAVLTIIYQTVQAGSLVFDWQAIILAGLAAGLSYIMKNLLTNSENKLLKTEKKK